MAALQDITRFLNKTLPPNGVEDESNNGLQVEGPADVDKIAVAVDACIESFEKAISEGAAPPGCTY